MKRSGPHFGLVPKILALPCGAALILAAYVGSGAGADSDVTIKTFQFKPGSLVAKAGTRVTWTNTDEITHTVTSGTPDRLDDQFRSPLAGKGATFSFTFSRPGTYPYFCERHPSMRGEIRVD